MLTVTEARTRILESISCSQKKESVSLDDALHRVLATEIRSSIDVPPADNSAMDGYAVITGDLPHDNSTLPVSQRITAGAAPQVLTPGTAARIFTGAEVPENADAVVMQENCQTNADGSVTVLKVPKQAENIREKGQDIARGSLVFSSGLHIQPQHIGIFASIGIHSVEVNKRVQVAIISTGNELVEPGFGVELKGGQIFNSNQPMLAALLSKLGCDIVRSHIIEDTFAATHMALKSKADSVDLIISSGGVSVGEADHVKAAVEDLGELQMWKVNMKPGKPVVYGHVENTPFLGLPGNPVSALVTFLLFAVPLIQKLQGRNVKAPLSFFVPALFTITSPRSRPEYMRVNIGERGAEKFVNQSSGVLRSVAWANALALVPAEKCLNEGDLIEVFPLELLTE